MPTQRHAPRRTPGRGLRARNEVQEVVDETVALYHWLAWVSDEIYGEDARGASRRWVLRRLLREGPLTTPAMARLRAIRRQSLQPVVDALVADGLVEPTKNPAHARSPLARLTAAGERLAVRLDRVDTAVLHAVAKGLPPDDLRTTAATLRVLRTAFGTKMRWRPAASAAREEGPT